MASVREVIAVFSVSDGHGSEDPRGSMGMGIMGMGVGDYIFTHTKPIPIAVGSWV